MKTKFSHDFAFSRQFLLEQFTSQEFYEKRMLMEGIQDVKIINFEDSDKHMNLTIKRELEINLRNAPRFIQKAMERLVNENASVSTHIHWNKAKAEGSIEFDGGGLPGEVDLKLRIIENDANNATVKGILEFDVNIPIVGKQIEKFAMPKVEKVIRRDFEKMEAYFQSL